MSKRKGLRRIKEDKILLEGRANGITTEPLEEFYAQDLSTVRYVCGFDTELKEYIYRIAGMDGTPPS